MVKTTLYQYQGPLGWPAVNPEKVQSYNVETNQYTRTRREQSATTYGDDLSRMLELLSVVPESEAHSAELLRVIEYRKLIDEYWEKLSARIVDFTSKYGSINKGEFKIENGEDVDAVTLAIAEMQGWVANIESMLEKISQIPNAIDYLTGQNYINEMFKDIDLSADNYTGSQRMYTDETLKQTPRMSPVLPASSTLPYVQNNGALDWKGYIAIYNQTSWDDVNQLFQKYSSWVDAAQKAVTGTIDNYYTDYTATYPRSTVLGERETRLERFKQDAYLMDSLLNDTNTKSVWVFLQIGNITFSTWDKSNYITDFNYKKNGAGAANSFTFNLAYTPPPGDTNINILEKITQKRKVFFQYGYNETDVSSAQYCGWILSYTVKLENNVLKYSIVGYSDLSSLRNQLISVEGYGAEYNSGEYEGVGLELGKKATDYAKQVLVQNLTALGYEVKFSAAVEEFNQNKEKEVIIQPIQQVTLFEAVEAILGQVQEKDTSDDSTASTEETDGEATDSSVKTDKIFTFYVDDSLNSNKHKTVIIDYIKTAKELDQTNDITPALAFSWGGDFNGTEQELTDVGFDFTAYENSVDALAEGDRANPLYVEGDLNAQAVIDAAEKYMTQYTKGTFKMLSNLIISFDTQYKGEVTLARTYTGTAIKQRYDNDGNLIEVNDLESKYITGEYSIQDENYSYLVWEKNTQFSYEATLTMVGMPTDIPIGTYVYIKPIVNGVAHHTAGYYFISGADDTVSNGQFTTTLKLVKIIDVDADDIFKIIKTKKTKRSSLSKKELFQQSKTKDRI